VLGLKRRGRELVVYHANDHNLGFDDVVSPDDSR
jgi:hypothetical protein